MLLFYLMYPKGAESLAKSVDPDLDETAAPLLFAQARLKT